MQNMQVYLIFNSLKQKKLIFNFFVNRNWKKLTDSRKRAKILADNRKSHHSIETLNLYIVLYVEWTGCSYRSVNAFAIMKEQYLSPFVVGRGILVSCIFMCFSLSSATKLYHPAKFELKRIKIARIGKFQGCTFKRSICQPCYFRNSLAAANLQLIYVYSSIFPS